MITVSKQRNDFYGYVVMSNHIHLIIQSEEGKLSDLIRDFKKLQPQYADLHNNSAEFESYDTQTNKIYSIIN